MLHCKQVLQICKGRGLEVIGKMSGDPETKALRLDLKADADGRVEGYASRFGEVDQGGDMVLKGAYADTIAAGRPVKMLWQHDPAQPIGVWDEVSEDDTGLRVRGRILSDVAKGREALALVRAGAIDGLSIGYRVTDADRSADGVRLLKSVDLWEVSLVTFPMQETARIDAQKAAEMTAKEFERRLVRDAGLTRSVARALMSGGMDAVKAKRDAGSDMAVLAQIMREKLGT
jgi:HK97 family phage prohead protease